MALRRWASAAAEESGGPEEPGPEGRGGGVGREAEEGAEVEAEAVDRAGVEGCCCCCCERCIAAAEDDAIAVEASPPFKTALLRFDPPPRAWERSFSYRMRGGRGGKRGR